MVISEPQSHAVQGDRENVIQAFNDWRAKEPAISETVLRPAFRERPSVTRRVFRTIALGFMAVLIAVAIIVLQSGSHEIEDIVSALEGALIRFAAVTHGPSVNPVASTKVVTETPAASQGTPAAATPQPTEEQHNGITEQIKTLANELSDVRHIVEQLATNQEKMAEDIAALKANEQSINQKLSSSLSHHPTGSAVAASKPKERPVAGAAGRSSTENSSVGAPLPLR